MTATSPAAAGRLTGLVLCGGESRRLGRDKALVEVDGVPLVLHVAARLATVADPIVLAPGRPGRLRLGPLPYREIADEPSGAGPIGGVVAGLAASPHPLVAAVAVDLPFASPEVLALLASLHGGEDAVVPVSEHGLEPLHAVYATSALTALRASTRAGRLSLRAALSTMRVRTVGPDEWRAADPAGRFVVNLNREDDLEAPGLDITRPDTGRGSPRD